MEEELDASIRYEALLIRQALVGPRMYFTNLDSPGALLHSALYYDPPAVKQSVTLSPGVWKR